ncbi:hypothetical protein ABZY81_39160 [Streptomyces sp. NPDC006514]|uniref:hypothetical protein n=1 Tax=Streptomyces sp. NPDC006514 TaxID=3154308 RepID=UPI0033AFA662
MVEAITGEFRSGTPAKVIARSVAPAFSRDQVTQYLAAVALHDSAARALEEAGLREHVDVRLTGMDAPREAHPAISVDPTQTPAAAGLAARIRGALRDLLITLDLPQGEHDEITDELIDGFLLDGQPVRAAGAPRQAEAAVPTPHAVRLRRLPNNRAPRAASSAYLLIRDQPGGSPLSVNYYAVTAGREPHAIVAGGLLGISFKDGGTRAGQLRVESTDIDCVDVRF